MRQPLSQLTLQPAVIGLGYSFTHAAAADLPNGPRRKAGEGNDAFDPVVTWRAMQVAVRNLGRDGLAATAISAVDVALWDPKAKPQDLPLASLLGCYRQAVPIYGSGGC
jgi:L-alanine-DL-glutamate epimerase-like enolase superfamily enzyme